MFSRKKKHPEPPSTSALASGLASSSRVTQQQQFPTNSQSQSQSHLQSSQKKQQSQPVCPWSAHAPPIGQSPSPFDPFLRHAYALSTSATTTGELFLFGGLVHKSSTNDLYVFSTRDFSTTLLQTSGDVPSPRFGHRAVLTSTTLLIWGGRTDSSDQNAQHLSKDDSLYLLNLGTSDLFHASIPPADQSFSRYSCVTVSREWFRIVVDGPGPGGRFSHTMTLVGSKLFVFGGRTTKRRLNDVWALDLNCCTFALVP
jgi:hypothetical protein